MWFNVRSGAFLTVDKRVNSAHVVSLEIVEEAPVYRIRISLTHGLANEDTTAYLGDEDDILTFSTVEDASAAMNKILSNGG